MFKSMAQKLAPKETVSLEELAYSNMLEHEALLRIMVRKGIITKEEYLDEIKQLQAEQAAKRGE
jgi:hypothetical protein